MRSALWCLALAAAVQARVEPLGPLTAVTLPGVTTTVAGATLSFQKPGAERRLVAWSAPGRDLSWARSVEVRGSLSGFTGDAHLALLLDLRDGRTWFRLGGRVTPTSRLSLDGLQGAAWNPESADTPNLAQVTGVRLGLVLDGAGTGVWTLTSAVATDEPAVRAEPLRVNLARLGDYVVSKQDAVVHTLAMANEGPHGEPVLRFDVTYPDPAHKWSIPGLPLPGDEDYSGLTRLRIVYKANFPGPNLLFGLAKTNNAQYLVEPPPPAVTDWRTVEVRLADLKLGSWSKDEGKLPLVEAGAHVQLGCHGAAPAPGKGTIWVAEVSLLP